MKHRISSRLLSLLLVLSLLVSCCPVVFAAQTPETDPMAETTSGTTEPVQEETESETTAPGETSEPAQPSTEPEESTGEAASEETVPETESSEETEAPEETVAEETIPEETEPEMPYGLAGLPEDYVLSEEALAEKESMARRGVPETVAGLTAGEDYEESVVLVSAESEADAEILAAAFSGELVSWVHGTAKVRLLTATVAEAVAAAADMALPLPAAYPNYKTRLDPMISHPTAVMSLEEAPTEQNWNSWVQENMSNPDPALKYPGSWTYQWMHDTVNTYAAWGVTTGHDWIQVAVIDSGVQADHPDLGGRVTSYDIGLGTEDVDGHGTHVAGIIGATMDNGIGGAGIAPNVSIMGIRVLDEEGSGEDYDIINGIYTAVDNGADVINMSLGGYFYNPLYEKAINYALDNQVTVVAAMGNDGSNTVSYPAAYDGVIGVVATDSSNERTFFSTYGTWADVAAPGYSIYSTYNDGDYTWMSGTSMACPVVTGVVALYMSAYGHKSPAEIEKRLESTATKGGSNLGAGVVNAAKMLSEVPQEPGFFITTGDDYFVDSDDYTGDAVPCESTLWFYTRNADDNWFVLYTLDGKTPSVKDGKVVNGIRAEGEGDIDLSAYAGSTVTVKAVQVNGLGMVGKVMTKKVKVAASVLVEGITISGPAKLIAGKSGVYTAVVAPTEKADQAVTWSIDRKNSDAAMATAAINAAGKLTTPSGKSGKIVIQAVSKADPDVKATFSVVVEPMLPVAKMTLDRTKATVMAGDSLQLSIASMVDAKGNPVEPEQSGVRWTSSNAKVAVVDEKGLVTAVAKGSATISCMSLDGSGKKASCSVTVLQPVIKIEITGMYSIAPGTRSTFKAAVYPTSANNRKVSWSLTDAPQGVTISTGGVVSVPASVAEGEQITIRATAQDGSGVFCDYTVEAIPKCTSIYAEVAEYAGYAPGAVWNKQGQVTAVNLFNVDLPVEYADEEYPDYPDNVIRLTAYTTGTQYGSYVSWTSSNPAVASVDDGVITAHKAGTAKITLAAMDGSNKKTTISVKVTVPVSTLTISTSVARMTNGNPYLTFGKSANHKVAFGNTYGKPTNKKLSWWYEVYEYDPEDENSWQEVTDVFTANKLITISSSGSLSVKKGVETYWNQMRADRPGRELVVTVCVMAMDGTYATDYMDYFIVPPTKVMKPEITSITTYSDSAYCVNFYCDQYNLFGDEWNHGFTVTSSNPKVASFVQIWPDGDGCYEVWFATGKPGTRGTAKITVKTTDGSNKSFSFNVKVAADPALLN